VDLGQPYELAANLFIGVSSCTPINDFLHPIILGENHFTSFKNDFDITLFGIFLKHTFWNKFYKFQIYLWKLKKGVLEKIFQNSFLLSEFSYYGYTLYL